MSDNFFNELHEEIKKFNPEENGDESTEQTKGCLIIMWLISSKLVCTLVLLWTAWIAESPLWYSILLSIIAAVNLLLPNTRNNQTMGWVRIATAVIAELFFIFVLI
jgi:hypothetical protein